MRNMRQGQVLQLAPLVCMMESMNKSGCNYTLDVMVFSEEKIIHYYDLRMDNTQVMGTLFNPNVDGVPYSQLDVGIAPDMVVEFEHYLNIVDTWGEPGIRCNFHKVSSSKEEDFYYHAEGAAYSGC